MVVLDEICMAIFFGLTPLQPVLDLIAGRPKGVELVLTGRRAPQALIEAADLVTEMTEVKHPTGVASAPGGIEL
jgi:cob(I)alamin adenosyltransferase